MHTLGSCDSMLLASCHNSSQRETFDWPTAPTAQRDLFDFSPLSVNAVVFRQTTNVLITLRHRLTGYRCTISNLQDTIYYCSYSTAQTYSFNLRNHSGSLTPNHSTAGAMLCPLSFRAGACTEPAGRVITVYTECPEGPMPLESKARATFTLDSIFTSSFNSDQSPICL